MLKISKYSCNIPILSKTTKDASLLRLCYNNLGIILVFKSKKSHRFRI